MIDKLNYFNDPNFIYNDESHSYIYINPKINKPSIFFEPVSGFISQFSKPFDSELIAKIIAKKRNVPYTAILEEWDEIKVEGLNLGSATHKWIEDFYKGLNPSMPKITINEDLIDPLNGTFEEKLYDRIRKFKIAYNEHLLNFKPIKQEFKVFSLKYGIAGTLDILFENNGKYYIGDWKTNKKFSLKSKDKLLPPFDNLDDTSLNKYSLQLSTYKLMLEEIGFKVSGIFLIWLGPGKKPKFSPASTAGRVKIIRLTSLFFKALTANATAVYDFPVPAGPTAKTISFFSVSFTNLR